MSGSGGGIYGMGRAFNLKYRPNGPLKTFIYDRRMPMFGFGPRRPHYGGGFDLMSTNVTYEYNRGFWGNLADIFTGLAAGFGIFSQIRGMFSSNSDIVQGPEESQRKPKPQGAKSDDDAANLKRLETFAKQKDITVVSEGNGKFTLMAKDGQNIKDATYKDAQDWIFNYNKKTETKTPAKESKEPEGTGKGKDAAEGTEGAGSAGGAGAAGGASGAGGAGGSRRKTQKATEAPETPEVPEPPTNNTIDKTKPVTKVINVQLQGTKGSATVTMPDGQTYTAYVNRHNQGQFGNAHLAALEELRENLGGQLRNAGWTSVTLKLPAMYAKHNRLDKNNIAKVDEETKDMAAQKADKANGEKNTQWTPEKKASYRGNISIEDVRIDRESWFGGYSNGGNAKVRTPDGHVYYAQTGKSMSYNSALKDIIAQLQKMIKADGWTQATVTNDSNTSSGGGVR